MRVITMEPNTFCTWIKRSIDIWFHSVVITNEVNVLAGLRYCLMFNWLLIEDGGLGLLINHQGEKKRVFRTDIDPFTFWIFDKCFVLSKEKKKTCFFHLLEVQSIIVNLSSCNCGRNLILLVDQSPSTPYNYSYFSCKMANS